ncbi:MAG: TlpA family protein disulfide reductase [Bacteroidales bacterium]|nr:TlpA family protein disulfide reductase [Bacteroidales bacterium]
MKKTVLVVFALVLLAPLCALAQKGKLTVQFPDLPKGGKVMVYDWKGSSFEESGWRSLDEKGRIVFTTKDTPALWLVTPEQSRDARFFAMLLPGEKSTVEVSFDQSHDLMVVGSSSGSANMRMYGQYTRMLQAAAGNDSLRRVLRSDMERLVADGSGNLMSALLVTFFENEIDRYAPLYKQVYDALSPKYGNNELVRHLRERLGGVVAVGLVAPDIVSIDTAGHQRKLSDLRGKVVLIDFWASWCGPCRMENPNVVRLYGKYHDRGFEVFSVSLDKDNDKWRQAIVDDKLIWENHVSDLRGWNSAAGRAYGINSIPATVLVDRDGTVLARNLRGMALEEKLKEIFGE